MNEDRSLDSNYISFNTDLKVFKGGLGVIKDLSEIKGRQSINNKKSNDKKINNKVVGHKPNSKKIVCKDNKPVQFNNGQISFRTIKKDQIKEPIIPKLDDNLNHFIKEENGVNMNTASSETKKIIHKLSNLKKGDSVEKKTSKMSLDTKYESDAINKVFPQVENKGYFYEKEVKVFENDLESNDDSEYSENEEGSADEEPNESENFHINEMNKKSPDKDIFFDFRSKVEDVIDYEKIRSKSSIDLKKNLKSSNCSNPSANPSANPYDKEKMSKSSKKSSNMDKQINSIICTLSGIEKGKATFVSSEDFIFILPTSHFAKNLVVGNSYIFRISEFEQFQKKVSNLHDIQKKYVNKSKIK